MIGDKYIDNYRTPLIVVNSEMEVVAHSRGMDVVISKRSGESLNTFLNTLDIKDFFKNKIEEIDKLIYFNKRQWRVHGLYIEEIESYFLEIINIPTENESLKAFNFNTLIESAYDGFFVTDGNGVVIKVNKGWENICGLEREDVLGHNVDELVDKGYYSSSAARQCIDSKQTATQNIIMQGGKNIGRSIVATGVPIINVAGDVVQVVVNVRDISEILSLKNDLKKYKNLNHEYEKKLKKIGEYKKIEEGIIVSSPKMEKVYDLMRRVAKVDSNLIITGKSGVGKTFFAKKIHDMSNRRNNKFISINCAAIPESLLESELFGYKQGSFTGALSTGKVGLIEEASSGTLFLDDISTFPLSLQAKLLKVIEEKKIRRLGDVSEISVDTRFITATNINLKELVEGGKFREDLYYRINVIEIEIPPLSERRDDIFPLIQHFMKKLENMYGKDKKLDPSVINTLLNYGWEGNIRQLENTLEMMYVISDEDIIDERFIPADMKKCEDQNNFVNVCELGPMRDITDEMEQQIYKMAKERYKTTREIGKILEVDQSTVVRKLHKYNIDV